MAKYTYKLNMGMVAHFFFKRYAIPYRAGATITWKTSFWSKKPVRVEGVNLVGAAWWMYHIICGNQVDPLGTPLEKIEAEAVMFYQLTPNDLRYLSQIEQVNKMLDGALAALIASDIGLDKRRW